MVFQRRNVIIATAILGAALLSKKFSMFERAQAQSADADVLFVEAIDYGEHGWTFHVTVTHPDSGWEDYCDGWDVVTEEGLVLKTREHDPFTRLLLHPHENEQPFTRSQSRIRVPEDVKHLTVRAHDIVHGFGGKTVTMELGESSGDGYRIIRQGHSG